MHTVRLATVLDVTRIAEIHIASWRKAYAGIVPQDFLDAMDVEERKARWTRSFLRTTCTLIVAEVDNNVVGFCDSGKNRDADLPETTAELYTIYLDPEVWGQGLGAELWKAASQMLTDQGFTSASVWVIADNARAIRFYEQMSFVFDGTSKVITLAGADLQEVRMICIL